MNAARPSASETPGASDRAKALKQRIANNLRDHENTITWIDGAVVLSLMFLGYTRLDSRDFDLLGVVAFIAAGAVFAFDQYRYNWALELKTLPRDLNKTVARLALGLVAVTVTYWIYRNP